MKALSSALHEALRHSDWAAFQALMAADAVWRMPGTNAIAGQHRGSAAVTDVARRVATYGMRFDLRHVLVGSRAFALYQHNTAEADGRRFDEHVATVCHVEDGRIAAIDTLVSDLLAFDRFFQSDGSMAR